MCANRSHGNCGQSTGRTKSCHDRCIHNENNGLHHRKYIRIYYIHKMKPNFEITPFGSICEILKLSLIRSFCIERSIYKDLAWSRFLSYFLLKQKHLKWLQNGNVN